MQLIHSDVLSTFSRADRKPKLFVFGDADIIARKGRVQKVQHEYMSTRHSAGESHDSILVTKVPGYLFKK
jgi:hypothetical protein